MTKINKSIDINKKYVFPKGIAVVRHKESILVISIDTANWIVLQNEQQLRFFDLLKRNTIKDAIDEFGGLETDVYHVVTQIEAKSFENTNVVTHFTKRLHMYLTNACNLRCPHCYMYAGVKEKEELSKEEICHVLDCFKGAEGVAVTFSGGRNLYEI